MQKVVSYYVADVVTANDYYPFGMTMPGRKYSSASSSYRYGFNGKELDNSTGEGNLDFGARILDVRLGKWLSLDPLMSKYPNESPYLFVGANPIIFIDPDGKDRIIRIYEKRNGKTTYLKTLTEKGVYKWGTAHYNQNIHMKMNIHQDLTLDRDNNTQLRTAAVVGGYQKENNEGFSGVGKLIETASDWAKETRGEGKSGRGGWTLTSEFEMGPEAGLGVGKPSGSVNVDLVALALSFDLVGNDSWREAVYELGTNTIDLIDATENPLDRYVPEVKKPKPIKVEKTVKGKWQYSNPDGGVTDGGSTSTEVKPSNNPKTPDTIVITKHTETPNPSKKSKK
ncbi:MAG: RHS repeat domain-containing protein [Ferruginibacter sp.]